MLRRVWTPPGEAPIAVVRPGYEWLYVASFVHPESGRSSFWLFSGVDGPVFDLMLKAFAEEQDVGRRNRILLGLDQAGWHGSHAVSPPEGLTLVNLPPYSPELQPVERVWPLVDEPLANRAFRKLTEVETVLDARCVSSYSSLGLELSAVPDCRGGAAVSYCTVRNERGVCGGG